MNGRPGGLAVLFRVAAGPRVGFGHLVRAVSLARALGVTPVLSIRGGREARATAERLGATVVEGRAARRALRSLSPTILVIDDRVAAKTAPWRRAGRQLGIRIASIHDLGIGLGDADLVIDGSLTQSARSTAPARLGPRYAILRPELAAMRTARRTGEAVGRRELRVLVALGGGPRWRAAVRIAALVAARAPSARVSVAGGFIPAGETPLPPAVEQVPPEGFDRALAAATLAVTGGGVTLYEACCLGVPAVAVAVVESQRPTIAGVAERGAAVDAGLLGGRAACERVAAAAVRLLADASRRETVARRGRSLVDGRGAERVAAELRRLAAGRRPR